MTLVTCSEIDYYYHYRFAKLNIGRQYQTIPNAILYIRY